MHQSRHGCWSETSGSGAFQRRRAAPVRDGERGGGLERERRLVVASSEPQHRRVHGAGAAAPRGQDLPAVRHHLREGRSPHQARGDEPQGPQGLPVPGVQQGVRAAAPAHHAREDPHRGETLQLRLLRKDVQPELQPHRPHEGAHGREAVLLFQMREKLRHGQTFKVLQSSEQERHHGGGERKRGGGASEKEEGLQMLRVQPGVQPEAAAGPAPQGPHRRETVHLRFLRQDVHAELQPRGAHEAAHGREAVPVPEVRQEVRQQPPPQALHGQAHRRHGRVRALHHLRQDLPHGLQPEGAHGGAQLVEETHQQEAEGAGGGGGRLGRVREIIRVHVCFVKNECPVLSTITETKRYIHSFIRIQD